jgi:DNA-binding transcriptional LysR family regulator
VSIAGTNGRSALSCSDTARFGHRKGDDHVDGIERYAVAWAVSDWENYHSFLETFRKGSFAKAARTTGLSHPTVRRRIEALEHDLGVALFTRAADGLQPTAAARQLQRDAEAMEGAAETFLAIAAGEAGVVTGVVRISCGELTAQELMPQVIRQLRDLHPRLALEVAIDRQPLGVLHGEADIAVQMTRPTLKALCGRRVGTIHIGLFAHERYIATAGTPASVADLARFSLIGTETDMRWKGLMHAHGLALNGTDFAFRSGSHVAQFAAMRAGIGIGLVNTAIATRDPSLTRVLADDVDQELEPWVVTHEDLRHEPRIRAVMDALVEQIAAYQARRLNA